MALSDIKVRAYDVEYAGTDLGSTSGGVSISTSHDFADILSDQKGSSPIDYVKTGSAVEVSLTILELNAANWELLMDDVGASHTPSAGTKVTGVGSSRNFTNMSSLAGTLRLRPVGNSDASEDVMFWKAFAVPDSIEFTSDSPNSMSVTFRCIPDTTKRSEIEIFCYGDNTQTLTA